MLVSTDKQMHILVGKWNKSEEYSMLSKNGVGFFNTDAVMTLVKLSQHYSL